MQLLAQEVTRLHSELRSACQQQLPAHTAPPPLLSHKQGSNLSCNPESANKAMIKGRRWCVSGAWGKGSLCWAGSGTPSPHPWSAKPLYMQNLIMFLGSRGL